MTPQEQQLLNDLTTKINSTVLQDKDAQAEQFLTQSLGRNPDAAYIMAQTILVQNYALTQAQQQLQQVNQQLEQTQQQLEQTQQQLQQQAQQPQKHTSFLGNLLGMDNNPAPPPPMQQQYAPPPTYGAPQYAQPMPYGQPMQYGQPMPQQGGFLRSAMQTATGVAAGALAFEGIESLMHGFGNHAGYGSGFGGFEGGGGMGQPREEVINNYYGDSGHGAHESGSSFGDRLEQADGGSRAMSSDVEDRRDNNSAFADADSSITDNDDSSSDNTNSDDSSSDNFDPTGDDNSF